MPHPDDEVLLFGGLIATQRRRQLPVTIVAVTDGEASHPGLAGLAARRRDEQHRALIATGEDRDLWRRVVGGAAMVVHDGRSIVETSARRLGRAPGGFASDLAELGGKR